MAVNLTSQVWELVLTRSQQTVLHAMADHAHPDGTNCFPSVRYLAWKTGYSERQVQRILSQLEKDALIKPVSGKTGGRSKTVNYTLLLGNGVKKEPYKKTVKGDIPGVKGDISNTKGDILSTKGDIAVSPEPSYNHQKEPSSSDKSQGASMASVTDILHKYKKPDLTPEQALNTCKKSGDRYTSTSLGKLWKTLTRLHFDINKGLTQAEYGMLSQAYKEVGDDLPKIISTVLSSWVSYTKFVCAKAGLYKGPQVPALPFFRKHLYWAQQYYGEVVQAKEEVQSIAKAPSPKKKVMVVDAAKQSSLSQEEVLSILADFEEDD